MAKEVSANGKVRVNFKHDYSFNYSFCECFCSDWYCFALVVQGHSLLHRSPDNLNFITEITKKKSFLFIYLPTFLIPVHLLLFYFNNLKICKKKQ